MPPDSPRPRTIGILAAAGFALAAAATLSPCNRPTVAPADAGAPLILCAGDSITAASYPDRLRERLEREGYRVRVENAGRNGNTSGEYLRFLRASRLHERTRPAIVLLQLGTNDVRIDGDRTPTERFRRNLSEIIDLVEAGGQASSCVPIILLATIPAIKVVVPDHFDHTSMLRVELEINPAIREIAAARGLPLVDNHALFAARPELLPDIHPTEAGYAALADNWHDALVPLLAATPGARR
jgi:lysophospholipase L1-like esterase